MEIMVNLPEDAEAREALARRAAQLHAEAIRGSLEALHCPKSQKKAVLNAIYGENRGKSRQLVHP